MTEEAQRWKEKYLKSIEQQEKLERRWNARLDLLRRGLVRSTLAAEGTDKAVDLCMKEMREVVRTDDMDAGLAALIPRLEKAVLDSEQRRETRVTQISTALTALVDQLQTLPLSRDVSKPLKKFAKQVEERAGQAREIPLLLSELSGLQGQAIAGIEANSEGHRPGLFQRLFGGRDVEGEPQAQPESQPPAPVPAPEPAPAAVQTAPEPAPQPEVHHEVPAQAPVVTHAPEPAPQSVPAPEVKSPEPRAVPAPQPEPEPPAVVEAAVEPPTPILEPTIEAVADQLRAPEPHLPPALAKAPTVGATARVVVEADAAPPVYIDRLPLPAVMAEAIAAIDPEAPGEDVLYALPPSPEPSYSSVAAHIEETLLGLLNDLALPERHRPQAEAMRDRLQHGLNWYELLPILDDLATLMLAINDSGQHDFELYLKQLNERLDTFQSHLQAASEGHADSRSAARDLDSQLREHVGGLQSSMKGATDVASLKQILEQRLEGLIGTIDAHQQQRDQREQEIATRLQGLAERVASMEGEAQGYREHLEEQRQKALIDPLTGLPNRAAWSERLEQAVALRQEDGSELLLAMLDLDHFKSINDSYGHLAGDKVLKIIANEMRKRLRPLDFMARFGGEEFVLLMPQTPMAEGLRLVEALRAAVESCPFHFKGQRVTITISIGIAGLRGSERSELALKRADEALYRAKDAGRNRVLGA
ncbi:diguanylate cyclase [Pseudomonas sp. M47T1]|uniref:diguanylate cyclase n=1 Tax=Pseudomonas sp. M47T1 TaxID=1179778 RepID=UPI0002606757|nr:diguanylate cyclase [Pseudomonas sp. M47T1]EIK97591.1 diguanylate cyclase [Pseudomonas sp. M47T1]